MPAAIIAFFLSPLGRYLAIGLVVVAALSGIYLKGYSNGEKHVQAKWDAAVQAAIERGEAARSDAERTITDDPNGLRDPDNRDRP